MKKEQEFKNIKEILCTTTIKNIHKILAFEWPKNSGFLELIRNEISNYDKLIQRIKNYEI